MDRVREEHEWIVSYRGSRPRIAVIELTTRCNLHCIHCFRNALSEPFVDMPRDKALSILENLKRAGIEEIVFSGFGEPLVYPYIEQVLEVSKKYGFRVTLNTNGTLLSEYLDTIYRFVDRLVISFDVGIENLYSIIRRGGILSEVVYGIEKLNSMKRASKRAIPILEFWTTVTSQNVEYLENVIEIARKLYVIRVTFSHYIPIHRYDSLCCLCRDDCVAKYEKVYDVLARRGFEDIPQVIALPPKPSIERECPYVIRRAVFIRVDGGVAPCMHYAHRWRFSMYGVEREIEPVIFGYAHREDLLSVWRSKNYTEFRFRAYYVRYPSCLDCRLAPYCSYTYSNEHDCWGNTPTCAHCPYLHRVSLCPL